MGSDMTSLALRDAVIDLMPDLRCFARSLTGSVEAGDELVQAAHQLVISRPHSLTAAERPTSWTCRIIRWTGEATTLQIVKSVECASLHPPVAGGCFFGKMAGSERFSRSKGVAAGLIRRKAGFRAFSFSLRFRFVGLIRRKSSA
jgi:hypothetical protein